MIKQQINQLRIIESFLSSQVSSQNILIKHHRQQLIKLQQETLTSKISLQHSRQQLIIIQQKLSNSQSAVSLDIQQSPIKQIESSTIKNKIADFSMQYAQLSKQISKLIKINKSAVSSHLKARTSFTNSKMFNEKINLQQSNFIQQKIEKSQKNLSQKEQILVAMGSLNWLTDKDAIAQNLIKNLQKQEQRYVSLVLKDREGSTRDKMRNLMERLWQKNQQNEFKLRQENNSMMQNITYKSRNIIKSGYTQKMKKWIQTKKSLQRSQFEKR